MPLLSKSRLILLNNRKLQHNLSKSLLTNNNISFSTNLNSHPKYTQEEIKQRLKHANDQRKLYKKQVSELRKQYAKEIEVKRLEEAREKEKLSTKQAIEVAKRRKVKLLRSIENERKQREIQAERRKAFEEYLKVAQVAREARRGRFEKARRLVIEDLEAESHLWMATPEEVDKVFDDKVAMQELWTNPHTIGARPKDSEFWRFQSHTADMSRSYPKRREILLDSILDDVFAEENVDSEYWSNERLDAVFQRKQRAKLHAMIRRAGRRRLLQQQQELMKEHFTLAPNQKEAGVPLKLPPPDLNVLADEKLMEEEGLKVLFENPEAFFIMKDGKVLAVKDEFSDLPNGTPFPEFIADMTPLDKPKEKKTQKKSKQQQQKKDMPAEDTEADSVDKWMDEESPDYISTVNPTGASSDEIEQDTDLEIPEEHRFTHADVDWVVEKLQSKISYYEQLEARDSKIAASEEQAASQANALGVRLPSATSESEYADIETQELDLQEVMNIISTLTPRQRKAMEDLDVSKLIVDPEVSMNYIIDLVGKITDGRNEGTRLSREQVRKIVELEYALAMDKDLADTLMEEAQKMDEKQNDSVLDTVDDVTSANDVESDIETEQTNDATTTDDDKDPK